MFPVAGWVFETVDAGVMDNGVMTAGICGDDHDALLTLLKEPYQWTVPEGSAEKQPDEEEPLSQLYDPLRPMGFADTGGTWSGFDVLLMLLCFESSRRSVANMLFRSLWNPDVPWRAATSAS